MRIQDRIRLAGSAFVVASVVSSLVSAKVPSYASEPEVVPGEYVVKIKKQYSKRSLQALSSILGGKVIEKIPAGSLVVVQKPVIQTATSVVKLLNQNSIVEFAEPNYIYRAEKTPNDPLYSKLWGLKNYGQNDKSDTEANDPFPAGPGIAGVDIDAEKAWDVTTGSEDVVVAVIDTGIDYTHSDLKDNMWTNMGEIPGNGIDDDKNGYVDDVHGYAFVDDTPALRDPMDDHGHGSHCAGTIAGRGDDSKGIVGVSWKAKLMAVKFLSAGGGGTLVDAVKAIDYARINGAKIMSNSWGGGGPSDALKESIERANAEGIIFIAAAGNDGTNNDEYPHYPSNYAVANVVSVAAINNQGNLASFSNYGKRTVHLAAPGVNIFSSVFGNGYETWSGTSMATPHVSGVAALLLARDPSLSVADVKSRLISSTRSMASLRGKAKSGGMVNAFNAVMNIQAPPDMDDPENWESKTVSVSSAHPYAKKSNEVYEVRVSGAKQFALYFSKFDTERGYDKVTFYDVNGAKLSEMSGFAADSFSPTFTGDYVKIVLTSDDSVEKYGFDISKIAFR